MSLRYRSLGAFRSSSNSSARATANRSSRTEVARRRKQAASRKLPTRRAFYFLHPVIESSFRHAHQFNRVAIFHAVQKIYLEELQPAFPLRAAQRLAADSLEVRQILAGASACGTP